MVRVPFLTVVPVLFLAPPPDLPHAPATRTRTRAVAPTTRAVRIGLRPLVVLPAAALGPERPPSSCARRCSLMRMGFCPLSECASDRLGRGGRADEGLIL